MYRCIENVLLYCCYCKKLCCCQTIWQQWCHRCLGPRPATGRGQLSENVGSDYCRLRAFSICFKKFKADFLLSYFLTRGPVLYTDIYDALFRRDTNKRNSTVAPHPPPHNWLYLHNIQSHAVAGATLVALFVFVVDVAVTRSGYVRTLFSWSYLLLWAIITFSAGCQKKMTLDSIYSHFRPKLLCSRIWRQSKKFRIRSTFTRVFFCLWEK